MPFDAKATGWSTIFQQSGKAISVPEELTKKWWDKKKQLAAKTRATGIGAKLDEINAVFKRLDFPSLGGNPIAVQGDIDNCKKLMNSSDLKSFRDKLKEVRDKAKEEAVVFKKSALTKKTAEVLEDIRETADQLFVACNASSLSTALSQSIKDWQKDQKEKGLRTVGTTLTAIKAVIQKTPGVLNTIRSQLQQFQTEPENEAHRTALGGTIRGLCRDTTQPLGNLMKAAKAGAPLTDYDEAACTKLYTAMVRISNTKGTEFMDDLKPTQAAALVKMVESWAASFSTLCGDVRIGTELNV